MTEVENLHVVAMEECDELSQRISKQLRFGFLEIEAEILIKEGRNIDKEEQKLTNKDRVKYEFNDLIAALELLYNCDISMLLDENYIDLKKKKIQKFITYSKSIGRII